MPISKPFLIAGPCSAESRSQVIQTAKALKEHTSINLFRAGLWKPRTRPENFEGVGGKGITWLKEVKDELGLEVCTEVGTSKHVELCLNHKLINFWIGTRTTASPFAIQELCESFKGIKELHIFIKNPINPELNLWIGAVERILKAGIKNISLVHRGFSTLEQKKYRHEPLWKIAEEMKKEFPLLNMILDPSHISGNRKFLKDVIKESKKTNLYSGYMIESHLSPNTALTDAKQQVTPQRVMNLFL